MGYTAPNYAGAVLVDLDKEMSGWRMNDGWRRVKDKRKLEVQNGGEVRLKWWPDGLGARLSN